MTVAQVTFAPATLANAIVLDVVTGPRSQLSLPEHRQIELYSKRKALPVAAGDVTDGIPLTEIAGACRAFVALDAAIAGPGTAGGATSWERCRNLPRFSATQRLLGEFYRVARLVWMVASDPKGRISYCDGLIDFDAIVAPTVLAAKITPGGLRLLESAIVYYLKSRLEPYPVAYVEAMLTEYYLDLLGEVRSYSDENRGLYQFRHKIKFNRHVRLDCDNPRTRVQDGMVEIEIGEAQRDAARYPIDFFVMHDDVLHIVPVEALTDGRISEADIATWRAVLGDGMTLPAAFRHRFAHEPIPVNQPMT